jgi:hypothetical protein
MDTVMDIYEHGDYWCWPRTCLHNNSQYKLLRLGRQIGEVQVDASHQPHLSTRSRTVRKSSLTGSDGRLADHRETSSGLQSSRMFHKSCAQMRLRSKAARGFEDQNGLVSLVPLNLRTFAVHSCTQLARNEQTSIFSSLH